MLILLFLLLAQGLYLGAVAEDNPYTSGGGTPVTKDDAARIIGGTTITEDGLIPWQVSLQIANNSTHWCGGSILDTYWILTAAHCLYDWRDPVSSIVVVAGTNDLDHGGSRYHLQKVICHPGFNINTAQNDICLLKTKNGIDFSRDIQPVAVCEAPVPAQTEVVLCGWGYIQYPPHGQPQLPRKLQCLVTYTTSMPYCIRLVGDTDNYGPYLSEHMHVCVLRGYSQGMCKGDSGGGIVLKVNGRPTTIGVASWVRPCARGLPDVFISVCHYSYWIKATIQNN